MEPLDNASLEQQVVSRAHRMGQRWTVKVEVLAMRGTAEETLLDVQAELAAAAAAEARARERADDQHSDDERADSDDTRTTTNTRTSTRKVASRRRRWARSPRAEWNPPSRRRRSRDDAYFRV